MYVYEFDGEENRWRKSSKEFNDERGIPKPQWACVGTTTHAFSFWDLNIVWDDVDES